MKNFFLLIVFLLTFQFANAQTTLNYGIDTTIVEVNKAVIFLQQYVAEFKNVKSDSDVRKIDFAKYWSKEDCKRNAIPDEMVLGISSDYPTYKFSKHPCIIYAKPHQDYVHLKLMLAGQDDSTKEMWLNGITNHYVVLNDKAVGHPYFMSEMQLHKENYDERKFSNITYHFPKTHHFNHQISKTIKS
jgi:hypothetical protein